MSAGFGLIISFSGKEPSHFLSKSKGSTENVKFKIPTQVWNRLTDVMVIVNQTSKRKSVGVVICLMKGVRLFVYRLHLNISFISSVEYEF
jgi:hypothetical protein